MVTPFLPGDSLLFAAGALAAAGGLNVWMVIALLAVAASLGDGVNYAAGRAIGPRIFNATDRLSWWHRLLNREHLEQTHAFFEKYAVARRGARSLRADCPDVCAVRGRGRRDDLCRFRSTTSSVGWCGSACARSPAMGSGRCRSCSAIFRCLLSGSYSCP